MELALDDPSNAMLPNSLKGLTREQLLKKEEQLREKENLLLKLQQQPGYAGAPTIDAREHSRSASAALRALPRATVPLATQLAQLHIFFLLRENPWAFLGSSHVETTLRLPLGLSNGCAN